ncbi:MAG: ATP-binding protein [Candidatus Paceibacterota bacterium]|jgi:signal transduction histidine kinase
MKIVSLHNRLFIYLLTIVAVLSAVNLALAAVHLVIVDRYERIQTNIFNEYKLINVVAELVTSYNLYRNAPDENKFVIYERKKADIRDTLASINSAISDGNLRGKFLGVSNTVADIIAETDGGIKSLQVGDIEGTSLRYTEANRKLAFIRENITGLILQEIQFSDTLRLDIQKANRLFIIFGGLLLTSVVFSVVGLSGLWSRRLISPLTRLTEKAESVTKGDFDTDIEEELIQGNDEVGRLARSFDTMLQATKKNIATLKSSNVEIQEKSSALASKIIEAENSRRAILNLLEDIKDEKNRAESTVVQRTHELADEKARLVASINSLSFGFVIADKDDTILLRNPALNKIFEFDKEPTSLHDIADELRGIGKTLLAIDPIGSCKECMEMKKIVEIKNVFYKKKFLRIFCAPIANTESSSGAEAVSDSIGYVFLVEDVTEAKALERSRDEFFSIASHELRTPLTAIRGNSEMVLDMYAEKIKDPDLKEMLVDIHSASIRLIDIVNDFLEVSRIEQGKIELKFENLDVQDIVKKVVKDMRNMAQHRDITLVCPTENAVLPKVRADRNRIEQVLINLVGNALKFTTHGGITVTAEPIDNFIKVSVADTGIGISEENQALLFRKFQQAGESTLARDVTQGTGLGLYISQLLMSSMGGTIGLEKSSLGHGSTFAFTIPVMV